MASVYISLPLLAATITGGATETTLNAILTELQLKADLTETQPVSVGALTPSFQEILNLTTSVQTFTAPAGAKWAKISADGLNSGNIRFKMGGTASGTSGIRLEPSRTEDLAVAGNISVIAESGSGQAVCVIFGA